MGFHGNQNIISFADDEGYSDGVGGEIIPKDDSVTLPPFKDVLGNDLQYVGSCPSRAKYVGSPCFQGDNAGYYDAEIIDDKLRDGFTLECWYLPESEGGNLIWSDDRVGNERRFQISASQSSINITLIGSGVSIHTLGLTGGNIGTFWKRLKIVYIPATSIEIISGTDTLFESTTVVLGGTTNSNALIRFGAGFASGTNAPTGLNTTQLGDVRIVNAVLEESNWPLTEPIIDPANHTAFDIVGSNHATLINGSVDNQGSQDVFHWGEQGIGNIGVYDGASRIYNDNSTNYSITLPQQFSVEVYVEKSILSTFGTRYLSISDVSISISDWGTGSIRVQISSGEGSIIRQINFNGQHKLRLNVDVTQVNASDFIKIYVDDVLTTGTTPIDTYIRGSLISFTEIGIGGKSGDGGQLTSGKIGGKVKVGDEVLINTLTAKDELNDTILYNKDSGIIDGLIPASAALDGTDALGNPLTVTQDGKSFLGTCSMEHVPMARVIQADLITNFWFDAVENPIAKTLADFTGITANQIFSDISETDRVKNIRTHRQPLEGKQLITDTKITNN